MPERPAAGRAVVTRRAVTDIVRTAVLGSYGVVGFATTGPWGHVVRWFGLREPGIRIVLDELRVDVHLRVAYGLPVAEVARQVDSAVRYALHRDLGREPGELTIHVDGLVQRVGRAPMGGEAADAAAVSAEVSTAVPETTPSDDTAPRGAAPPAEPAPPAAGPAVVEPSSIDPGAWR